MRFFVCSNEIGPPIPIDVANCDILYRADYLSRSNGRQRPAVRIGGAEGNAEVVRILVHRSDIQESVAVDIGDLETVAAAKRNPGQILVVDPVLPPRDIVARARAGTAWGVRHRQLRGLLASYRHTPCRRQGKQDRTRNTPGTPRHQRASIFGALAGLLAMSSRICREAST